MMPTISTEMKEFTDTLIKLSVHDHRFTGPLYTWSNHQPEGPLVRKLDTVLINDNWLPRFGHSMVEFLAPEVSDHCLALIMLQQVSDSPPKPFRFFNFWTKHAQFLKLVEDSWVKPCSGDPMKILHEKLKRMKQELKRMKSMATLGLK